jgi:hypothetical protein
MSDIEVKVRNETVGIRLPQAHADEDGFKWLSLEEVWALQEGLERAVQEAWAFHRDKSHREG